MKTYYVECPDGEVREVNEGDPSYQTYAAMDERKKQVSSHEN